MTVPLTYVQWWVMLYYIYINYQKENCLFDLFKFFLDNVVGVNGFGISQFSIFSAMKSLT